MSTAPPPPALNSDQCKDSCQYALGVAEQFLTLAVGGMAFVVGMVFSNSARLHPALLIVVLALLSASICLGLFVRMGIVSNIRKNANYDVYEGPVRRVAALQILAFLIAVILLAGWTLFQVFCPPAAAGAGTRPSAPGDWHPVGPGLSRGISGIELFSPPGAEAAFVVVHDNKAKDDGPDPQPRLALITRRDGGLHYHPIRWPVAEQPTDLEALAAVPGRPGHYCALTSRGRLYTLAINADGTAVRITHESELPNPSKKTEFESFEIAIAMPGNRPVAVWIARGSTTEPAHMLWAPVDPGTMTIHPGAVQSTDLRVPWPSESARPVSDAKIDGAGTLFISATSDPGDEGPFASAVYAAGTFTATDSSIQFLPNPRLTRLYVTMDHKIEALALWPGAGGALVLGSDDEAAGGAVRIGW